MKPAVHQYEDKLLEFAYGELPRPEAEAVDAHVRNCPRCTEALGQIREVRTTMGHLPMEAAPATGLESLMAYAEQTAKRNAQGKPKDTWWRRLIMPMATVAALAVVGVVAWRANEEFKPDPVALALDQQRAREAEAKAAPAPQPVVAKAEPAAPTGAQALAPQQEEVDLAKNRKAAGAGWNADKMANAEAAAPSSPTDFAYEQKPQAAKDFELADAPRQAMPTEKQAEPDGAERTRGSMTKRESKVAKKKPAADARDDWSNAAQRGALRTERNDGTTAVQALEGNAVGGSLKSGVPGEGGPALGLSAGSGVGKGAPGQAQAVRGAVVAEPVAREEARKQDEGAASGLVGKGAKKARAKEASADDLLSAFGSNKQDKKAAAFDPGDKAEVPAQAVPAPKQAPAARAPVAAPPPTTAVNPPSSPAPRSSLGLSLNAPSVSSASGGRISGQAAEEDELMAAGEATVDRVGVDRDAAYARRQRTQDIDARLKQARAAANRGDRLAEVKLCLEALDNGAEGYHRVEALKRACDGLEALGEFDRAQPFCDRLVKEFGSTAAARSVIERRKQRQLVPPAYDSALESERKPVEQPAKANEAPRPASQQ